MKRVLLLLPLLLLLAGCQVAVVPVSGTPTPQPLATMTLAPATPLPTATLATEATVEATSAAPSPAPSSTVTSQATPTPEPTLVSIPTASAPVPRDAIIPFDMTDSPEHLIGSYVNAINRQEYARAYSYWANPPQSLQDFTAGFADTRSVLAMVRPPMKEEGTAGTTFTIVPTLLLAIHTDGTRHAYHACYTLSHVAPGAAGHPTPWEIWEATAVEAPNAGGWPFLLACPRADQLPGDFSGERETPERLLASYIDAINRHDYQQAYAYWENPSESFDQFYTRWQRVDHVALLVREPAYIEGAAGSMYARLATLLLITRSNGTRRVLKACYTTRATNPNMTDTPDAPPVWSIMQAQRQRVKNASGWRLAGTPCPE